MTDFLTEIPRWVTNLAFWTALLLLLVTSWGVLRSIKGMREDLEKAVDDVYDFLAELKDERHGVVQPLSAPLSASGNVVDIPTTRTAVARTDQAVEGLKAELGIPTDPNKLTRQPAAATEVHVVTTAGHPVDPPPTEQARLIPTPNGEFEVVVSSDVPATNEIPAMRPDDPGRIASNVTDTGWAYVLSPDYQLEVVDGQTIPAFRHPDDDESDLELHGATRLDLTHVGGRHRAPGDDE
jgi:hypothetical protein